MSRKLSRSTPLILSIGATLCLAACGGGSTHTQRSAAAPNGGAASPTTRSAPTATPGATTPAAATRGSGGQGGGLGLQTARLNVAGQDHDLLFYAPLNLSSPRPLLFVLHGQGGNAQVTLLNGLNLADQHGFVVAATSASGSAGGWVESTDAPVLGAALGYLEGLYDIDLQRRYLWGFSAGGHFAHLLGLANSDLFAAYATSAGVLTRNIVPSRLISVSLQVGDLDPLLAEVEKTRQFLTARGHPVTMDVFQGGHTVAASHRERAWQELSRHRSP